MASNGWRPSRYGLICGCHVHVVCLGQCRMAEPIPLHARPQPMSSIEVARLGPGHVDSVPLGSCIPDGDFIEEVHTPILRCHVNTLAFGSPEPACKAAGDCGGWGCPVPVQNKNSAHCPRHIYMSTHKHTHRHMYKYILFSISVYSLVDHGHETVRSVSDFVVLWICDALPRKVHKVAGSERRYTP